MRSCNRRFVRGGAKVGDEVRSRRRSDPVSGTRRDLLLAGRGIAAAWRGSNKFRSTAGRSLPRHPGHRRPSADDADTRLRLAEAAFAGLGEVVLDRNAYTDDAVRDGRFGNALFIVGADEGAAFPGRKDPDEVLRWVKLAVGTRSGYPPPDLERYGDRVVGSSSTRFRCRRARCASASLAASRSASSSPRRSRARFPSSVSTGLHYRRSRET